MYGLHPTSLKEKPPQMERRTLYGKAGAFRPKSYGVEHRVLGNTWIFSRIKIRDILNCYLKAIASLNAGLKVEASDYSTILSIINDRDFSRLDEIQMKYARKLDEKLGKTFNWADFYSIFA